MAEAKSELGARLKRLARSAGYTAETLAERLGCSASAVWAWWSGRNEPSIESLRAYATAVAVSVDYLVGHETEPMGPVATLQEWRLRFADLIRQGVSPEEAIDRISLPASTDEEMTDEEYRLLVGGGPVMREVLEDHSGGQWETLNEEQRAAVLQVIRAMAHGNRPERAPPDDAAPE